MSIIPSSYQEAKIHQKYDQNKSIFTLFTWDDCHACPVFIERLQEALKVGKLKTKIRQVRLDENYDLISQEVRSFPTLMKTFQGKSEKFDISQPIQGLISFLSK